VIRASEGRNEVIRASEGRNEVIRASEGRNEVIRASEGRNEVIRASEGRNEVIRGVGREIEWRSGVVRREVQTRWPGWLGRPHRLAAPRSKLGWSALATLRGDRPSPPEEGIWGCFFSSPQSKEWVQVTWDTVGDGCRPPAFELRACTHKRSLQVMRLM